MNKKLIKISLLAVSATLILSACSSSRLLNSAEKVEEGNNKETVEERVEREYKEQIAKWEKDYVKFDKTVDEAVDEVEKEVVGEKVNIGLVMKDKYTDPREMAKFTSEMLFKFTNGDLTPQEYIEFIKNYGSATMLESTLTLNADKDLALITTIQNRILDAGIKYSNYELSTPNVVGNEITFYRKMVTTDGKEAYFKTKLIKNNDGILFYEMDDMSYPVQF